MVSAVPVKAGKYYLYAKSSPGKPQKNDHSTMIIYNRSSMMLQAAGRKSPDLWQLQQTPAVWQRAGNNERKKRERERERRKGTNGNYHQNTQWMSFKCIKS